MWKKAALGAVILGVIGVLIFANLQKFQKNIPVQLAQVTEGTVPEAIFVNGKLESLHEVTIHPEVTGTVKQVFVKAGDSVKKGQLLFQLDTSELEEQLKKEMNSLSLTEQEQQKQRKENFEAFKKKRFEEGPSAVQDPTSKPDNELFALQIESHRLAIDALRSKAEQYAVKASEDGVVTEVKIKEGQSIPGGTPAVLLTDPNQLQVRARLNELDANKVSPDMQAKVTGDAFAKSYAGRIRFVAPQASLASAQAKEQSVELLVQLSETSPELKPGYSATVEIDLPGKPQLVVPASAVKQEGDQAYVYQVREGVAVKAPVKVGKQDDRQAEILEGLKAGDAVIGSVPAVLTEGRRVTVS